jgi:hypothetical protein
MGLDMYLTRKTPVWSYGTKEYSVQVTKNNEPLPFIESEKIEGVIEEVAYWRKFNALHNWFVENVQDGVDKCQTSAVTLEQLKSLLNLLKEVQENSDKAEELLPTTEGFFFGGIEYDDYYFEELSNTIEVLEKLINDDEKYDEYFEYFYHASW